MTKQCKALEIANDIMGHAIDLSGNPGKLIYQAGLIIDAINEMQDRHEAALAKAQGEWVDIIGEAQIDDDNACWYQVADGSIRYDLGTAVCNRYGKLVRLWQPTFRPPAPPPIPEPEIEVPDLGVEVTDAKPWELYEECNEAHKAAMLPLLKRIKDLEEGRA